jgi:hypothetical protein
MAILNKTGITNGSTIQSEHVTRTIDALTGGSTDTIVATGSFNGTLTGTVIGILTGTASFATSATSASYAPQFITNVTGSIYTNPAIENLDLIITGSVTTYAQVGNKGFQRYTNAINTLGVWGDIISANTAGVVGSYSVVQLNDGAVWQTVDQSTYNDTVQPLLGIALDKKSAGNVLLNGYITAYTSGSLSGSGMQFANSTTPRIGYAVWVYEGSTSGSISVDKPTGAGAVINIGHVIASGSSVATAGNRLIRFNPRYISTI